VKELSFQAVNQAPLANVGATFGTGTHVILGTEWDGTGTLIELAAGRLEPTNGRVLLDGAPPWSNAQTRRRIACVSATETLPPARDVAGALGLALRAAGDARAALYVLGRAGLAHFAGRRVSTLTGREARAVALALALSHPTPALLALHEPLGAVGILREDFLLHSLNEQRAAGSIILCSASRVEDAARLGGSVSALSRGTWLAPADAKPALGSITLRVHTAEPRRLAARLSEAPDIRGVEWAGGNELVVHGSELERLAGSVVANARAEAIRITAIKPDAPSLEILAAARANLAQAYAERMRAAETGPVRRS